MNKYQALNNAQARARRAGLRLSKRGPAYTLYNGDDQVVATGDLTAVLAHMPDRRKYANPGKPTQAWQQIINAYMLTQAAAGLPTTTLELRRTQLAKMARGLGGTPTELTADHLVAWFGTQAWAIETRRSYRGTIRGFLRWAYRTKRLPVHLADELPPVREHHGAPRPTPDRIWREALMAADPRVKLMLRLAAECGLRRAEVACLHTRDLIDGIDGAQLLVHGKGNKQRVVPVSDALAAAIGAHAPAGGWLFPNHKGTGHLTPPWVGRLVREVLPPRWTMHQLRHRFASRAYRGTRNLRAVQILLGHQNLNTTQRYTAVDDGELRAAMTAALDDAI